MITTYLIKANQKRVKKDYECLTSGCNNQAEAGVLYCRQCDVKHIEFMSKIKETPIRHLAKRR